MPLGTADIEAAARGDRTALRRILLEHSNAIIGVSGHVGYEPHKSQAVRSDQQIQAPPIAGIAVIGKNGHYYVTITPSLPSVDRRSGDLPLSRVLPGDRFGGLDGRRTRAIDLVRVADGRRYGQVQHQLQSATNINFDAAANVTTYGPSTHISYDILDPNQRKFWRVRSRFPNSDFNAWTFYINPEVCGPVAVDSGVLVTGALSQVNAAYTPTTLPLSAATGVGVNQATINIAAFVVQYPTSIGQVAYNSGSITPLLDSTHYYVYCLDPHYAGGAQTYIASTVNPEVTANESLVYLGSVTTPAHGGGGTTGSGGGGGPCFTGNTLVITKDGIKQIANVIPMCDEILTQRGWRMVRALLEHPYSGPMQDMGADEFVTPDHRIWFQRHWERAVYIFRDDIVCFTGPVFNLSIMGDGFNDEQCYVLANGWIAHNLNKL